MADATEEDGTTEESGAPAGKGKLVVILMIVNLVIVLAVAGGAVAFVMMGGGNAASASAPAPGTARTMGPLMEVSDMVVNLSDEDHTHFVHAGFQFELEGGAEQSQVESHVVPIRSAFLLHFSGLSVEDTVGREAREALLEQLKTIANEQIGADLVAHVYFTAFVVQ